MMYSVPLCFRLFSEGMSHAPCLFFRVASPYFLPAIFGSFLFLVPSHAMCSFITADTTWSGEVAVEEDILIPQGVTLTIAAGTTIRVTPSDSTKTDPEFLSPLTEITVRGTLVVDGEKGLPVSFVASDQKNKTWAGIIIDGGKAVLRSSVISDAETGVSVVHGALSMTDSVITKNRYGLTVQGDSKVRLEKGSITGNEYGVFLLSNAKIDKRGTVIRDNRKKDLYAGSGRGRQAPEQEYFTNKKKEESRVYGDEALLGR